MKTRKQNILNQSAVVHLHHSSQKIGLDVDQYIALHLDKPKIEVGSVHWSGRRESEDIIRVLRESRYTKISLTEILVATR